MLHGAAVWVDIEPIRGAVPIVGTWGFAAYALYSQPWLVQPVSILGVYGVSLLIVLVNYALAQWMMSVMDRRWLFDPDVRSVNGGHPRRWLAAVGTLVVMWIGLRIRCSRAQEWRQEGDDLLIRKFLDNLSDFLYYDSRNERKKFLFHYEPRTPNLGVLIGRLEPRGSESAFRLCAWGSSGIVIRQ